MPVSSPTRCSQHTHIVPKSDPENYRTIRDAKDWKNPYLIVRREGIEVLGITPAGEATTVDSVPGILKDLPRSAWPYGCVVAVEDIDLVSARDLPRIRANRHKLLDLLRKLGVAVNLWPA